MKGAIVKVAEADFKKFFEIRLFLISAIKYLPPSPSYYMVSIMAKSNAK
jgi:hypothetical protein